MTYITVKASPRYRQMTLEDLLFGTEEIHTLITKNETGTITYERNEVPSEFIDRNFDAIETAYTALRHYSESVHPMIHRNREELYHTFYIPKRSGGLRRIDAPCDELSRALRSLKEIMEEAPGETYHTSAYAYVPGRCTVDAVKRHQQNESQWFAKFDLHNFFGSTTKEFLIRMLSMIFPYNQIMKFPNGICVMENALDLCFKDGGLPQGTPISPFLTNLMMIPIDYKLSKAFRNFDTPSGKQTLIYTRYADDFLVSSRYGFSFKAAEDLIREGLEKFGAPFSINTAKTRYGSRSGSNWNLGVMLNKDNEITVGHQKKKQLQNMLFAYAKDRLNGVGWEEHDIRVMEGLRSYCRMVEGDTIDRIVQHVGGKLGVDIPSMIREDLRI